MKKNIDENNKNNKIEKISRGRFMVAAATAGSRGAKADSSRVSAGRRGESADSSRVSAATDSGDSAVSCTLPDGSVAFILSDGMGKGMKAAAESQTVIAGLRKQLKDGVPVSSAIKEINSRLIEKGQGEENFATIDLSIIDPKSGKAKFYKMGATVSFIIRKGMVKRIQQPALPVGMIPKLKLTHVSMVLKHGDIVLMVSDGVTEADRNDLSAKWLEEYLLAQPTSIGPRVLATDIVTMAQEKYGNRETDDLSALVVKV